MTVKELMAKLKRCPSDSHVYVQNPDDLDGMWFTMRDVHLVPDEESKTVIDTLLIT